MKLKSRQNDSENTDGTIFDYTNLDTFPIEEQLEHNNPATLQNFAFNLRKSKFMDRRVRKAIDLAFNFEWANTKLFYWQYRHYYLLNNSYLSQLVSKLHFLFF